MLVFVAGCGQSSHSLVSPAQVQKAFTREGLQTRIVFGCFAETESPTNKSPCPAEAVAKALGAPHVIGQVADKHTVSKTNLESPLQAWVLDSTHAANSFNRTATYLDASGKTVPSPFLRLQVRNVAVQVLRRGDYTRKAQAALASIG